MLVCSVAGEAQRAFGRVAAQELITYIADMEAIEDAHQLTEHFEGVILVHENDSRLEIMASVGILSLSPCEEFSRDESGKVKWRTVSSLRLDEIEGFQ